MIQPPNMILAQLINQYIRATLLGDMATYVEGQSCEIFRWEVWIPEVERMKILCRFPTLYADARVFDRTFSA